MINQNHITRYEEVTIKSSDLTMLIIKACYKQLALKFDFRKCDIEDCYTSNVTKESYDILFVENSKYVVNVSPSKDELTIITAKRAKKLPQTNKPTLIFKKESDKPKFKFLGIYKQKKYDNDLVKYVDYNRSYVPTQLVMQDACPSVC